MICPKCGMKNAVTSRICVRCRFMAETGDVIESDPPRAEKPTRMDQISRWRARRLKERGTVIYDKSLKFVLWGVVPGAGHLMSARYARAAVYAILWCVLINTAFRLHDIYGQVLLALAGVVHAQSLYDLWPRSAVSTATMERVRIGIISIVVIFGVYWPLAEYLQWVEPTMVATRGRANVGLAHFFFYLGMVIVGVVLYLGVLVCSAFISGLISWLLPGRRAK